jgi:osmoprotectant transport system ATP-binding protein
VIFVTHDIDEAIKMGQRIAILREGGILAQYDTPDEILAHPADEFSPSSSARTGRCGGSPAAVAR